MNNIWRYLTIIWRYLTTETFTLESENYHPKNIFKYRHLSPSGNRALLLRTEKYMRNFPYWFRLMESSVQANLNLAGPKRKDGLVKSVYSKFFLCRAVIGTDFLYSCVYVIGLILFHIIYELLLHCSLHILYWNWWSQVFWNGINVNRNICKGYHLMAALFRSNTLVHMSESCLITLRTTCSWEKVFSNCVANLQMKTHAQVRFQEICKATLLKLYFRMGVFQYICSIFSENLFLRTPLDGLVALLYSRNANKTRTEQKTLQDF